MISPSAKTANTQTRGSTQTTSHSLLARRREYMYIYPNPSDPSLRANSCLWCNSHSGKIEPVGSRDLVLHVLHTQICTCAWNYLRLFLTQAASIRLYPDKAATQWSADSLAAIRLPPVELHRRRRVMARQRYGCSTQRQSDAVDSHCQGPYASVIANT